MSRNAGAGRAYVRPMRGWWRRNPFFVRYMLREATAVAVAVYAIVLATGVVRLAQGEASWNGWLEALRSPWSLLMHLVLLAAMIVHAKSWFEIMPKTMPLLFVRGQRVPGPTITRWGWTATVVASIVLLGLAAWGAP